MNTAMGKLVLVFILGILLRQPGSQPQSSIEGPSDAQDDARLILELCERANDRILEEIRTFNVIAYTLLGPLLAIVAFVDYHDVKNLLPLALAIAAVGAAFLALRDGAGVPTPDPSDRQSLDLVQSDVDKALRNVLQDLRRLGELNMRMYRRKRRAVGWAGRLVILATIATIVVKSVESSVR